MNGAGGPFMPWQALTERYSTKQPQQQVQAYSPPEEDDEEWYETLFKVIPFADTIYGLGDKIFGGGKKKKEKKGGAEEVVGDIASMFFSGI